LATPTALQVSVGPRPPAELEAAKPQLVLKMIEIGYKTALKICLSSINIVFGEWIRLV
jgi:hypothetical protein